MKECCDNPDVNYDTYNPGEVRLYGRIPDYLLPGHIPISRERFNELMKAVKGGSSGEKLAKVESELAKLKDEADKYPKPLITINVNSPGKGYTLSLKDTKSKTDIISAGVIYGYSFEGHCYKLPKPIIMLLPVKPSVKLLSGDCGYDPLLGYLVWVTDKLDQAVVLDVRIDDLQTLVLDANTPGSRSPLAYAQAQALSPQRG